MQLSRKALEQLPVDKIPPKQVWALPERVLQFGTGVLLRGLPDYFIDQANRQGVFNGRIVVVKSTANGGTDVFRQQDGMYTLLERGIQEGKVIDRAMINTAISRVLSAADDWNEVLACAANPDMQLVISNTTEVGIVLVESDATTSEPVSFPGRLLAFLEERYRVFNGSADAGMVVIPAELIVDNGVKLKNIVLTLARLRNASPAFINWLEQANDFCNSLVDCIVPGKLPAVEQEAAEQELGYRDELMIMSEPYRLWAIETDSERTRHILSFSEVNKGVELTASINRFRELKLRLLNATHTFSCGLAYLAGFTTVREAMRDEAFAAFVSGLMMEEIAPLLVQDQIAMEDAHAFIRQVIDRFRNPYIEHQWLSISAQFSSKMAMRCVPLIEKHCLSGTRVPRRMALGFAAYLLFTRPVGRGGSSYFGLLNGHQYPVHDDKAGILYEHWQSSADTAAAAKGIMSDTRLFGTDLAACTVFAEAVQSYLAALNNGTAKDILRSGILKQSTV